MVNWRIALWFDHPRSTLTDGCTVAGVPIASINVYPKSANSLVKNSLALLRQVSSLRGIVQRTGVDNSYHIRGKTEAKVLYAMGQTVINCLAFIQF